MLNSRIPDGQLKRLKKAGLPLERGMTFAQGFGVRLVTMALNGDLKAITTVREIVESRVPREEDPKCRNVQIKVVYDDAARAKPAEFYGGLLENASSGVNPAESSDTDGEKNSDVDPDENPK